MKNPRDIIPKREYYKADEIKKVNTKYVECRGIIGLTLYEYENGISKNNIWIVLIAFYIGLAWSTTWAIIWHDLGCIIGYFVGLIVILALLFHMPHKLYHIIDENIMLVKG